MSLAISTGLLTFDGDVRQVMSLIDRPGRYGNEFLAVPTLQRVSMSSMFVGIRL